MIVNLNDVQADEGKHFVHTRKGGSRNAERIEGKSAWCVQYEQTDGNKVPLSWVEKGLVVEVEKKREER
ncbi:hypothetical protein [Halobacillus amylolyticus]|uniref:Uncharacterized protein n=1 Tax=Halobacillus amylolyticus TaxID=2932259 RepID=A0ABY4HHE5_9BACI|nr:hypothetical protein [Halobacillus amylolyticus]UOR14196.1 hypothetical protein MUO15_21175 [Halobacillus amylolyticus]